MTELKHRKGACVMAYLILANEEARVRRTHGALENRSTKSAPVAPNGYLGKPKEIDDLNPYYLVGW